MAGSKFSLFLGANVLSFFTDNKAMTGPKLRVRTKDGALQIRPTDRKSGVNLPKDEQLIEIVNDSVDITVPGDTSAFSDGTFSLEAKKYGWFTLVAPPAETTDKTPVITTGSLIKIPDPVAPAAPEAPAAEEKAA